MNAVIDTNVLVEYLRGIEAARKELLRYRAPAVSVITWMDVLAGAQSDDEERHLRTFLDRFELLPITQAVADEAVHTFDAPTGCGYPTRSSGLPLEVTLPCW